MKLPMWKTINYTQWNDARISVPKDSGEYLCKVGLLKYCDCTEVDGEPIIYSYSYEILLFNENEWHTEYQDEKVIAWMPIPECDIE